MVKGECESGKPKPEFFYFITLPGIYLDMGEWGISSSMTAFTKISLSKGKGFSSFSQLSAPLGTRVREGLSLLDTELSLICYEKGPRLPLTKLT